MVYTKARTRGLRSLAATFAEREGGLVEAVAAIETVVCCSERPEHFESHHEQQEKGYERGREEEPERGLTQEQEYKRE